MWSIGAGVPHWRASKWTVCSPQSVICWVHSFHTIRFFLWSSLILDISREWVNVHRRIYNSLANYLLSSSWSDHLYSVPHTSLHFTDNGTIYYQGFMAPWKQHTTWSFHEVKDESDYSGTTSHKSTFHPLPRPTNKLINAQGSLDFLSLLGEIHMLTTNHTLQMNWGPILTHSHMSLMFSRT